LKLNYKIEDSTNKRTKNKVILNTSIVTLIYNISFSKISNTVIYNISFSKISNK